MPYTTHRQGLYRTGFRPLSNPYAATQLGITPFEPEVLHGLGEHVFTPGGGWGLHGLGDIVPNGSIVAYQGQWLIPVGPFSNSPAQLLAAVAGALSRDGLRVIQSSQNAGFWGALSLNPSFTATLQIQVSNGMGFGQPSDVASIVDHEVFSASGQMPQGSGASVVSMPGGSAPGVLPSQSPTDAITWLEQNAMWIGLGVLAIAVLPSLARRLL